MIDDFNAYYEPNHDSADRLILERQVNPIVFPHFHSCYEVLLVTEGALNATVAGQTALLGAGDLYVVESFRIHSNATSGRCRGFLLIAPESMIQSHLLDEGGRNFLSPFLRRCAVSDEIRRCFEAMMKFKEQGRFDSLATKGYLFVIFGLLARALGLSRELPESDHSLPKDVLLYMQRHFKEPLRLDGVAEQFGYSSVYFSRFFRRHFDYGFHQYLTLLRLRNAVSMVVRGGNTLAAAAMESGFENQRTFNRAFQRVYGMTPTVFVAGVRKQMHQSAGAL